MHKIMSKFFLNNTQREQLTTISRSFIIICEHEKEYFANVKREKTHWQFGVQISECKIKIQDSNPKSFDLYHILLLKGYISIKI